MKGKNWPESFWYLLEATCAVGTGRGGLLPPCSIDSITDHVGRVATSGQTSSLYTGLIHHSAVVMHGDTKNAGLSFVWA